MITLVSFKAIAYSLSVEDMFDNECSESEEYIPRGNVAIMLPEKFINNAGIPPGLLFKMENEGEIITR